MKPFGSAIYALERYGIFCIFLSVFLAGCAGTGTGALPPPSISVTSTSSQSTPTVPTLMDLPDSRSALAFYIKDGNVHVWEEGSGEKGAIFDGGDAISVKLSPDRQKLAYLRRTIIRRSDVDWYEQSSLWAMDLDGGNLRQLISAEQLRQLIGSSDTDSSNMPQVEWIPGTHRLAFTGYNYIVQAEGESHAYPTGLFFVNADTSELEVLVPAGTSLKFSPAPDGQRFALMSLTGFGFLATDGSGQYQELFAYPKVGFGGAAWPSGVWTQDSSAFILVTGGEVRRVPLSGSPVETLATLSDSHPDSVFFSPNGKNVSYVMGREWYVADLEESSRPVASTFGAYFFWRKILWSPAGIAYSLDGPNLVELCPDATRQSETCGKEFELGQAAVENGRKDSPADIAYLEWIDSSRFLFTTFEPGDLYFGNLDGEVIPISTDSVFFSAMPGTCVNNSEFAISGEGLQVLSVAADTSFQINWRLQNSGTCAWDNSYRLVYLGGDIPNPTANISIKQDVIPGGEVDLSVTLGSPAEAGTFHGAYRLFGPDGIPFGLPLPVDGLVPSYSIQDLRPDQVLAKIPSIMGWLATGDEAVWALTTLDTLVSQIDYETNQAAAPIEAGNTLQSIAVGYGSAWVVGDGEDLIRIDPATNAVSAIIRVPLQEFKNLNGVSAGAGAIWVSSLSDGSVSRIDPETEQVEVKIAVPWAGQIVATENAIWVTNQIDPLLTRIDPASNQVSAVIELECNLYGIDASDTAVWATCMSEPTLFRIDPATNRVVARFAVGTNPSPKDVALGPSTVWVTARRGGILMQIDPATNQVVAVYQLGQNTYDLAAHEDEVWVSVQGEGAIWRIRP